MLYIPKTKTEIDSPKTRYVHPDTGVIYGGTDYENPDKLAEIGAVPLRIQQPPAGHDVDSWTIVDDDQNPGGKLKVPATLTPWIITPEDIQRKHFEIDSYLLDLLDQLTVDACGTTFAADPLSASILNTIAITSIYNDESFVPIQWRDSIGEFQEIDETGLLHIIKAIASKTMRLYSIAWDLKDRILPGISDPLTLRKFDVTDPEIWKTNV